MCLFPISFLFPIYMKFSQCPFILLPLTVLKRRESISVFLVSFSLIHTKTHKKEGFRNSSLCIFTLTVVFDNALGQFECSEMDRNTKAVIPTTQNTYSMAPLQCDLTSDLQCEQIKAIKTDSFSFFFAGSVNTH